MAVVQAIILYGSEMWVLTPRIGGFLDILHHRVAQRLKVQQPRRGRDSGWLYPSLAEVMLEAGLHDVKTHVSLRQNLVAQLIVTRPIIDLCLAAEMRPGSRVARWWW